MAKKRNNGLIVFVVLHYLTIKDTMCCVKSIKEKCSGPLKIIIVDNGSKNGSGNALEKKYNNDEDVLVLKNQDNLGFAGGNNVGFKYAKDNFNPDFIVLSNNDVVLMNDLRNEAYKKYRETGFAVLGPKEYLGDGSCFFLNPKLMNKNELKECIKLYKYRIKHSRRLARRECWLELKNIVQFKKKKVGISPESDILKEEHRNIVLHGVFLVFSKKYINMFDGLDDRTFMYGEESLLLIRLRKHGLLSLYDPNIEILHNHSSATKAVDWNRAKRIKRRAECELESAKVFLRELESSEK